MNKNRLKLIVYLVFVVVPIIAMISGHHYAAVCFCGVAFSVYVLVWLYRINIEFNALMTSLKAAKSDLETAPYWREIRGENQLVYQNRLSELIAKYGFSFDFYLFDFQIRNCAFSEDVLTKTLYGENVVVESIAEIREILMQQQPPIKFVQIQLHIPYRAWQESLSKKEGQP